MSQGHASQRLRPFKPLRFGRYTLLMPLATGGMGEIFLAQLEGTHGFDKLCVIKKILPHLAQDDEFVSRFVDEAHILVKLSHGSIAQVLDMGVHETEPYIALEFVDGKDLRRVLTRMRERALQLPLSFVLTVMTRVLDALAYAHRKRGDDDAELNLVHRDVSPQNVLISYEGEVKVIDFGLAKSALSLAHTSPSIVLGKFMYMSPEQARHKPVDRRSDLYTVGLCLWELVTGKNPFDDVPPGELMARVSAPQIPPLNTVEPLCPQALSDAVARALAIDPAHRFGSAEEFRGRLQAILQDIDPLAGPESTSRFMRDAFAAEYQAERRMLGSVKEQARTIEMPAAELPDETAQNMPSPFAAHRTPLATPAVTFEDETPAVNAQALSFQPTRKSAASTSGQRKAHEVHERETLPSISLQAGPAPIRARVVAKSFDQEATEAATPAIAEPEALPSIVIDGIPSSPVVTELEMPAQQAPLPARVSKANQPRQPEGDKPRKAGARNKPPSDKPRAGKPERTAERPAPRQPKQAPARTDTQVLEAVPEHRAPSAKTGGGRWVWLMLPALALVSVGGYIGWDLYDDQLQRDRRALDEAAQEEEAAAQQPTPVPVAAPEMVDPEVEEPTPLPKGEYRKKAPAAAPKAARGGTAGEVAFSALQEDFDRVVDESVQRRFRLKLTELRGQLEERGADPAYVARVKGLHEQVKLALSQQR